MALTKFPPPPDMGRDNQKLNRWLIEIQSILNSGGTIDPNQVDGLVDAYLQIAANTTNLAALTLFVNANVANLQSQITTLQGQVAANTASIATNTADIVTLSARAQVLNAAGAPIGALGNNGDLYINNTGAAGSFLYGKIAGSWIAFA